MHHESLNIYFIFIQHITIIFQPTTDENDCIEPTTHQIQQRHQCIKVVKHKTSVKQITKGKYNKQILNE